jgi:hypothetical protein
MPVFDRTGQKFDVSDRVWLHNRKYVVIAVNSELNLVEILGTDGQICCLNAKHCVVIREERLQLDHGQYNDHKIR